MVCPLFFGAGLNENIYLSSSHQYRGNSSFNVKRERGRGGADVCPLLFGT